MSVNPTPNPPKDTGPAGDDGFERRLRARREQQSKTANDPGKKAQAKTEFGIGPHIEAWRNGLRDWKNAAVESTKRKFHWVGYIAKPVAWTAKKLWQASVWTVPRMFTYKGPDGHRHFAPKRSLFSVVAVGLCAALSPHYLPMAYYYGTESTYQIYLGNAALYHNQQFNTPNERTVVAPRDEIISVMAEHMEDRGKQQDVSFDIDVNGYYLLFNPRQVAAAMQPKSPYGSTCTVRTVGIYTIVPRGLRYQASLKMTSLRPEIVGLKNDPGLAALGFPRNPNEPGLCHQVTPEEFNVMFGGARQAPVQPTAPAKPAVPMPASPAPPPVAPALPSPEAAKAEVTTPAASTPTTPSLTPATPALPSPAPGKQQ